MQKEYKRTCKSCGKVWHSLKAREDTIHKHHHNINPCHPCSQMCNPHNRLYTLPAQNETELNRLRSCPECKSNNYDEEVV